MDADELFAQVAMEWELVAQAQIDECRALSDPADARRPLPIRLLRRGLIAYADFVRVLDECKARRRRVAPTGREPAGLPLFGRLGVEIGLVTPEELDEALRIQAEGIEAGIVPVPRLGEVLMDQRRLKSVHVQRLLAMQGITHMTCLACRAQYNVMDAQPERVYSCRACRGMLVRVLPEPGSRAVHTVVGRHVRHRPGAPEAVTRAAFDPENHFGEFVLVEPIPRPGLGSAHRAWDGNRARWVLLHHFAGFRGDLSAARDESRRAGDLPCGAFPQFVDAGDVAGVPWLALEWRDAPTLARLRPGLQRAAQLLAAAAEALAELHGAGLVHGNLTPFAIRIDLEGGVSIAELGLAPTLEVADAHAPGLRPTIDGTPAYLAPEMMRADGPVAPSPAGDIYALGAVLYNLMTSKPPAEGDSIRAMAGLMCRGAIVPPRKRNAELPKDLERVCLRAMALRPADRYGSMEDLARDLTRFAGGLPIAARRGLLGF